MPTGPPLYADQLVGALLNMTRRRDDAAAAAAAEEEGEEEVEERERESAVFSPHRRHRRRHEKKKKDKKLMLPGNATFSEVVLFVEACEAGSMFEGMLPSSSSAAAGDEDDDGRGTGEGSSRRRLRRRLHRDDGEGIFALTAANPHESSWGVFCPGMPGTSPQLPEGFDTCLGDLFAVSWMREAEDPAREPAESLEELARVVAEATSRNGTFEMGSHVSEYGDKKEEREELAAAFLGVETGGEGEEEDGGAVGGRGGDGEMRGQGFPPPSSLSSSAVPQRAADLLHLRLAAARGSAAARESLELELRHREIVDGAAAAVAAVLLLGSGGSESGGESDGASPHPSTIEVSRRLAEELSELHGIQKGGAEAVAALVEAPLLRRRSTSQRSSPGQRALPVVEDWECLRAGVRAFTESPGCAPPPPPAPAPDASSSSSSSSSSSQFALRHSRLVARACNAGTGAEGIAEMIATACAGAARRVVSA